MATILANGLTVPQISLPTVMPDSAYYDIEVVVTTIGIQFVDLKNSTGTSTELTQAVNYQNKIYQDSSEILANQASLTYPSSTLSTLTGWVSTPATIADTIKNMWITLNDMRYMVSNTLSPIISSTCSDISVNYQIIVDSLNSNMTLLFIGYTIIPEGYVDSNSQIFISDGIHTITLPINILNASKSTTGISINLNNYNINPYTDLTTTLTYSFTNGVTVCPGSLTLGYAPTYNPCVNLSLTGLSSTSIQVVFSPTVKNGASYLLQLYNTLSGGTFVVDSGDITDPTGVTSYTFTGLTTGRTYYVVCIVTISGTVNTCPASYPITI
jgi:hypothetical protein